MRKITILITCLFVNVFAFSQWVDLNAPISGDVNGVYFSNLINGVVVGQSGIFRTIDGGTSWTEEFVTGNSVDSLILENTTLNATVRTDNNHWYAAGKHTPTGNGVIFKQAPNSAWELVYTIQGAGFNDITKQSGRVISVGEQGIIVYSLNNGSSWVLDTLSITNNLKAVTSYGTSATYAGGDSIILYNNPYIGNPYWEPEYGIDANGIYYTPQQGARIVNQNQILSGLINGTWTNNPNFSGTLDATSFAYTSGQNFIGSENGILRSTDNNQFWEWLPSADGYSINDLHMLNSFTGYAVGDNGAVLKTADAGGFSIPYVSFSTTGGCLDSNIAFGNTGPLDHSYLWKLDGDTISTTYSTGYFTVGSIGTHTITLIGTNGPYSDSLTQTFEIVAAPDVNKSISIEDSILCKMEDTDFYIHDSELGVEYLLHNLSTNSVVDVVSGNGNDAVLNTGVITDSTWFVISARHPTLACEVILDTFLIGVEHTKAIFHIPLVNATMGQTIHFYNYSQQATYYDWSFGTGANPTGSAQFEEDVTYNAMGSPEVTLIAISQYGCRDTLTKDAPYIYDINDVVDNCWALNFDGNHVGTYEHDKGEEVKVLSTGDVIVSGSYSECEFNTRAGLTGGRDMDIGFFIASYTTHGVLNWMVKGIDQDPGTDNNSLGNYSFEGSAFDLAIDENDNIYISGWIDNEFLFYSNEGKIIPVSEYNEGLLMKINSAGIYQWHTGMDNATGQMIGLDANNNIYVGGRYHHTATFYSASGSSVQQASGWASRYYIAKYDSAGELLWQTDIYNLSPTYYFLMYDLAVDPSGNVYVTGEFSGETTFNSVSGSNQVLPASGGPSNAFVARYNTHGNAIWALAVNSIVPSNSFDKGLAIEASQDGDVYVTLEMRAGLFPDDHIIVQSTQIPDDTLFAGRYAVISYDSIGNYRWGAGSQLSGGGRGTAVTIDDQGNVYTAGYAANGSSNPTDFSSSDTTIITLSASSYSFFIAKYTSLGNLIWVTLESGLTSPNINGLHYINSITTDQYQNVFITGTLHDGFDGYVVTSDTLYTNRYDAILAKFSPSACLQPDSLVTLTTTQPVCPNDTIEISFTIPQTITIGSGNTYFVELSDANGSFASPTVIGALNSTDLTDTISAILPSLGPGSYYIRVSSSNPTIIGNEQPLFITSPTPTITQNGNTLTSNVATGVQWYLNGNPIPGANDPTYIATQNGSYFVVSSSNGCSSISNTLSVLPTGLTTYSKGDFSIYPNPANETITINLPENKMKRGRYKIVDATGKLVLEDKAATTINVSSLAAGLYNVVFENGETPLRSSFIKH